MKKIIFIAAPILIQFTLLMMLFASCMEPSRPTVKTKPLSVVDHRTMLSGGDILDDGGSEIFQKGVIISHDKNPTMNPMDGGWGVDGYGNASYESVIIGGVEHVGTVYARAYAINGAGIGYGDVVSYTF